MVSRDVVDAIMYLRAHIMKRRATSQVLGHHVISKNAEREVLKPNFQKYQAASAKRNAITSEQQFFWYALVKKLLNDLQDKIQVGSRRSGKYLARWCLFLSLVLARCALCRMLMAARR